ncbi:hypothetical protein HOY80DRAFT_669246 [Tuber brumale]|nr:hypothetical protein HOY80DRAFT_669246 [Tuber brumale]
MAHIMYYIFPSLGFCIAFIPGMHWFFLFSLFKMDGQSRWGFSSRIQISCFSVFSLYIINISLPYWYRISLWVVMGWVCTSRSRSWSIFFLFFISFPFLSFPFSPFPSLCLFFFPGTWDTIFCLRLGI